MAQQISGNDMQGWGGWIPFPSATYVSATSFSVPGDYTSIISPGAKFMLTQNGAIQANKYFYIVAPVTFSSGNTTFTVTGGSDYSLTNAAIIGPAYSLMNNPATFPQWFNWTPTIVGFSANPANAIYRFKVEGRTVVLNIANIALGTSNSTSFTLSLPITASSLTNYLQKGPITAYNNGAQAANPYYYIPASATTVAFAVNDNTAGWTASSTKGVSGAITYEF